ncbi:MAG: nuclear transport factor 2 family protein [Clostridiales bacterium]|nr:nuclear transport factor 2 family protein [Clostridiales bacterium]
MDDKQQIALLYDEMYTAMIQKDLEELDRLHDDSFTLMHMTGKVQNKKAYINSIHDGTLNYYAAETEHLDIDIRHETAKMTGLSRVLAAVYGGRQQEWPLKLEFTLQKRNDCWRLTSAKASMY